MSDDLPLAIPVRPLHTLPHCRAWWYWPSRLWNLCCFATVLLLVICGTQGWPLFWPAWTAVLVCAGRFLFQIVIVHRLKADLAWLRTNEYAACLNCGSPLPALPERAECPACSKPYSLSATRFFWEQIYKRALDGDYAMKSFRAHRSSR
ncbi:MAG: hypothetical protein JNM86_06565 [Phycisphaerae bacterium]|nr:hypothetical protein [Phycisphaerae bacterium]